MNPEQKELNDVYIHVIVLHMKERYLISFSAKLSGLNQTVQKGVRLICIYHDASEITSPKTSPVALYHMHL